MEEQNSELRADPAFKLITDRLAKEIGLRLINAEFPQSLTADMVLEIPSGLEERLESSIFSFLKGYQYAIIDFKGENDRLTLHKFLTNLARTTLFCLKRPEVPVNKVLNLYVTSSRPDAILDAANHKRSYPFFGNSKEQPWHWQSDVFFQEIAIVVCRDLPIEPRYYDWLMFTPAGSDKWKQFVRTVVDEQRVDLIDMLIKISPKEFRAMELDLKELTRHMTPRQRRKKNREWAEVIEDKLPELAEEDPEIFDEILGGLAEKLPANRLNEIAQFLSEQARKKMDKNGDTTNGAE